MTLEKVVPRRRQYTRNQAMSEIASVPPLIASGPSIQENAGEHGDQDKKKKKAKVRSAWISFIGRIVAQLFGAVATVMLGLQVVQNYLPPPQPAVDPAAAVGEAMPVVTPARRDGVKTLAVLPVANYSGDSRHDAFSDGLTEALIAELAQVPGLQVTSRTSSMHFRDQRDCCRRSPGSWVSTWFWRHQSFVQTAAPGSPLSSSTR